MVRGFTFVDFLLHVESLSSCVMLFFTACLCLFSRPSSVCTCVSFAHLPLCLYCQSVFFLYSLSVHLFLFRVSCVSCLPLPLSWSSYVLCVTNLLSVASDFSPVFYFSSDFPSCFLLFTFLGVGLLDFRISAHHKAHFLLFSLPARLPLCLCLSLFLMNCDMW